MIDSKVVLFEIEKGEIPDLTWTQDDATKNIWSAPYTLINGMSDIATLNDSTMNGYFKCATEADLAKNIFSVKLDKNYVFDLPDTDDTIAEVVAYLKAQTYSSTAQTWLIGGTGSDVVFTSTEPPLAGPLGYSLNTECPAGNISSSIHTTINGVRQVENNQEIIQWNLTNTSDEVNAINEIQNEIWTEWETTCGYPTWDSLTTYNIGDKVLYRYLQVPGLYAYECTSIHSNHAPVFAAEDMSYWKNLFEGPIVHSEVILILRNHVITYHVLGINSCLDANGGLHVNDFRPFRANTYTLKYSVELYNSYVNSFIYNPPPPYNQSADIRLKAYNYMKKLQEVSTPYYYIDVNGNYTTAAINEAAIGSARWQQYLGMGFSGDQGTLTFTSIANASNPGPLGFIDSGSLGYKASVVCTQEGGSGYVAPVHEVETCTIQSVSDDYRLFFYDPIASSLKVRLPYGSDPSDLDWNFAIKKGYSNFEGYWNPLSLESPLFYEGRIQSVPNITYSKDSSYYSIVSFDGGSITLNNTDGLFDNLDTDDVYGQICTLRYSYDSGVTWSTVYTGSFESYQLNGIPGQCIVNVYDKRKALSMSLPPNSYSITTYPYLNTNNDGLVIPLAFGDINRAPVVCLNETEVPIPTDYVFKCCDTSNLPIESIDGVYLEGVEVTPENIDLTAATFTLPSTVYVSGKAVSADLHGYVLDGTLLQHPIRILEYILSTYLGIQKNSFNFNLTQWNLARDKPGIPDIGYLINSSTSIIDIIGEISNSVFGTFLIQKDGLITFKIRDVTVDPVLTIRVDDQLQAPVQDYKSDEYMNTMRVGYRKAHTNGRYSWVTIDTDKQALHDKYRVDATKEVQTLLVSKSAATTYGNSLYEQFAGIFPTFTIVTKSIPPHTSLELEDLIEVEVYINPDGSKGTVILELLGVDMDLNTSQLTLTARYVRDGTVVAGRKLIKYVAGN